MPPRRPSRGTRRSPRTRPEYLSGLSAEPTRDRAAFLDRFARLAGAGPVLEIGSVPGHDADYLEERGVHVIRTDAAGAFVDLLPAGGHGA